MLDELGLQSDAEFDSSFRGDINSAAQELGFKDRSELESVHGKINDSPAAPPPPTIPKQKGFLDRLGGVFSHEVDRLGASANRIMDKNLADYDAKSRAWLARRAQRKALGKPINDPNDPAPIKAEEPSQDWRVTRDAFFAPVRVLGGVANEILQADLGAGNPLASARGITAPKEALQQASDELGPDAGWMAIGKRAREIADDNAKAAGIASLESQNTPGIVDIVKGAYQGIKEDPIGALGYSATDPGSYLAGKVVGMAGAASKAKYLKELADAGKVAPTISRSASIAKNAMSAGKMALRAAPELATDLATGTAISGDEVTGSNLAGQLPATGLMMGGMKLAEAVGGKVKSAKTKSSQLDAPIAPTGTESLKFSPTSEENVDIHPKVAVKNAVKAAIDAVKNGENIDPAAMYQTAGTEFNRLVDMETAKQGKPGVPVKTQDEIRATAAKDIADALTEKIDTPEGKQFAAQKFYTDIGLTKTSTTIDPETGAIVTKSEPIKYEVPTAEGKLESDAQYFADRDRLRETFKGAKNADEIKVIADQIPESERPKDFWKHVKEAQNSIPKQTVKDEVRATKQSANESVKSASDQWQQDRADFRTGKLSPEDLRTKAQEAQAAGVTSAINDAANLTIRASERPPEVKARDLQLARDIVAKEVGDLTDPAEVHEKFKDTPPPEGVRPIDWARVQTEQAIAASKRAAKKARKLTKEQQAIKINADKLNLEKTTKKFESDLRKAKDEQTAINLAKDAEAKGVKGALDKAESHIDELGKKAESERKKALTEAQKKQTAIDNLRGTEDSPGSITPKQNRTSRLDGKSISALIKDYRTVFGKDWEAPFREDFGSIKQVEGKANTWIDKISDAELMENQVVHNASMGMDQVTAAVNKASSNANTPTEFKAAMMDLAQRGVFQTEGSQTIIDAKVDQFFNQPKVIKQLAQSSPTVDSKITAAQLKADIKNSINASKKSVTLRSPASITTAAGFAALAAYSPNAIGQMVFGTAAIGALLKSLPLPKAHELMRNIRNALTKIGRAGRKKVGDGVRTALLAFAEAKAMRTASSSLAGIMYRAQQAGMDAHHSVAQFLNQRLNNATGAFQLRELERRSALADAAAEWRAGVREIRGLNIESGIKSIRNQYDIYVHEALNGRTELIPEDLRMLATGVANKIRRTIFDEIHNESVRVKGDAPYMEDYAPHRYDPEAINNLKNEIDALRWDKGDYSKMPDKESLAWKAVSNVNASLRKMVFWDGDMWKAKIGTPLAISETLDFVNAGTLPIEDMGMAIVGNRIPQIASVKRGDFASNGEVHNPHEENARRLPFLGRGFYDEDVFGVYEDYIANATASNVNKEFMPDELLKEQVAKLAEPDANGKYLFGTMTDTHEKLGTVNGEINGGIFQLLSQWSNNKITMEQNAFTKGLNTASSIGTVGLLRTNLSAPGNAIVDYALNSVTRNPRSFVTGLASMGEQAVANVTGLKGLSKKYRDRIKSLESLGVSGEGRPEELRSKAGKAIAAISLFDHATRMTDIAGMTEGIAELKRRVASGDDLSHFFSPEQVDRLRNNWESDDRDIREMKATYAVNVKAATSGFSHAGNTPEAFHNPYVRALPGYLKNVPFTQSQIRTENALLGKKGALNQGTAVQLTSNMVRSVLSGLWRGAGISARSPVWMGVAGTLGMVPFTASVGAGMAMRGLAGNDEEKATDFNNETAAIKSNARIQGIVSDFKSNPLGATANAALRGSTNPIIDMMLRSTESNMTPAEAKVSGTMPYSGSTMDALASATGALGSYAKAGEAIQKYGIKYGLQTMIPIIKQSAPQMVENWKAEGKQSPEEAAHKLNSSFQNMTPEQIQADIELRANTERMKARARAASYQQ